MNQSEKQAKEYIINDIIKRFKEELKDHNYKATVITVREETDEEIEITEILQTFLNEYTEKTENEKDLIGTNDLYEKWEIWTRSKYEGIWWMLNKTNIPINVFGRQMHSFYERGVQKTRQNKTIRGFKCIKYKSNTSKVGEFMNKFIIQTEDSLLDRIPMKEMYYKYLKWGEGEKIGPEEFNTQMQKAGTYKTKQAHIKVKIEKENGKTKVESIGRKYDTKLCVMKVKWIPGAVERLDPPCEGNVSLIVEAT